MLLGDYFHNIKNNYKKIFFSGISFNSNEIEKNNIFFAVRGNEIDGNNFIPQAIKKGAKIIITENETEELKNDILYIKTNNIRKLLAEISFKIYNKIPKNIIAVTGTNGKSSVADFYYQILKLNNKKVASIGTLGVKSTNINLNLSNTTIDPIKLGKILTRLKSKKIENIIMEASSHGLKQNRLNGLKFNSGVFTNLSQDHLDYHKNLKDYLKAKLYLFETLIKKRGNVITDQTIPEFKIRDKTNQGSNTKGSQIKTGSICNNDGMKKANIVGYIERILGNKINPDLPVKKVLCKYLELILRYKDITDDSHRYFYSPEETIEYKLNEKTF